MNEHEEQEANFKVTDRRLFNADGSVREGVVIEKPAEKPVSETEEPALEAAANAAEADATDEEAELTQAFSSESDTPEASASDDDEEEEIPGEQDPTSFVNFMMSLASQAAAALGAMPHPVTGQRSLDLDLGKHWIDTMAMLKNKTKGNLHPKEEQLLNGLLADLRMQFIQLSQAAEERLKQQAAQKFSSKDVLGGR
ncbi:MAG TPA: DUF1844 domain-containing protein [Pyrinomonadaceae bacterium]|jgi:hypothetical protein|nr:DUF1844 domain-containing protein [Pyrinomonadaceae bacterium]